MALLLVGLGIITEQNRILMKLVTVPPMDASEEIKALIPNMTSFYEEVTKWTERNTGEDGKIKI